MTAVIIHHAEVKASHHNSRAAKLTGKSLSPWLRLLPIFFFFIYLNFTVFLFAFGPWPWPIRDGTKLYIFLAFAHLALLLGYLSAAFGQPHGYYGRWKINHILIASLLANLLLLAPTALSRTGSLIPDINQGLTNPGAAYAASHSWQAERSELIEYLRILVGPLLSFLFPLTVYYWGALKSEWMFKVLVIISILGFVAIYIATGTNKAIADFVLLTPWLMLAGHVSGISKLSRKRRTAIVVVVLVAFVLFLSYFTAGQVTRLGSGAISGYFYSVSIFADPNNFLVRNLPPRAKIGVTALTTYLTQGYYALYLALDEPFVPTLGVGNSMFLLRNAARVTGLPRIEAMPYPMRIEKYGWDADTHWSTIYPWLASDVSFPGTVLVVFLVGRLLAQSWVDSLKGSNPFAVAALAQFLIMLFYFPANNQVLQSGEALTSFYITVALWVFTRRKYVWRRLSS